MFIRTINSETDICIGCNNNYLERQAHSDEKTVPVVWLD